MARYNKSSVTSFSNVNDELEKIETALDSALDREGGIPNQMEADLDLNSNDILNVNTIGANSLTLGGVPAVIANGNPIEAVSYLSISRQTATAGQTVFTVPTYVLGVNALAVYVNGVRQSVNTDYAETNTTTVTFTSGLSLNDVVEFHIGQSVTSATINDSEGVAYTPPFAGSSATTVEAKLSEVVSVKDFGAVGDGVTDDTSAIQAAVATGKRVYFPDGIYLCPTLNSTGITSNLDIFGEGVIDGNDASTAYFDVTANIDLLRIDGVGFVDVAAVALVDGGADPANDAAAKTIGEIYVNNISVSSSLNGIELSCKYNKATVKDSTFSSIVNAPGDVYAIKLGHTAIDLDNQRFASVYGNKISTITSSGSNNAIGIIVYGSEISVTDNGVELITGSTNAEGIYTKGIAVSIKGNHLLDAGQGEASINLKGINSTPSSQNCVCDGNTLRSTTGEYSGININTANVDVINNIIEGFGGNAVKSSSDTLQSIRVNNNHIIGHRGRYAILLQNAARLLECSGNTIDGCDNTQTSTNGAEVISITNVAVASNLDHIIVKNNKIQIPANDSTTTLAGIRVRVATATTAEQVDISGNQTNIGTTAASNRYDIWFDIDGTVNRANISGYDGEGVTQSTRIDGSATALLLDWFGSGTPEANVVGGIGSVFRRSDGGASTSLYIKESGTGNTGWVAK